MKADQWKEYKKPLDQDRMPIASHSKPATPHRTPDDGQRSEREQEVSLKIRVATYNINGVSGKSKYIMDFYNALDIDVIGLMEAWKRPQEGLKEWLWHYDSLSTTREKIHRYRPTQCMLPRRSRACTWRSSMQPRKHRARNLPTRWTKCEGVHAARLLLWAIWTHGTKTGTPTSTRQAILFSDGRTCTIGLYGQQISLHFTAFRGRVISTYLSQGEYESLKPQRKRIIEDANRSGSSHLLPSGSK